MVTTGPMSQVGWASACSGVTSASSARSARGTARRWRSAPAARTSSRRPPRRHWASALCSESTGTIWSRYGVTSGPPATRRLLVGQRQRAAGLQRGQRRGQPDRAGHAVEHDVARPGGELGRRVRPGQDLGQPELPAAVAAGLRRGVEGELQVLDGRSRATATTSTPSSRAWRGEQVDPLAAGRQPDDPQPVGVAAARRRAACVPIEPVEPSSTTSRGVADGWSPLQCRARGPRRRGLRRAGPGGRGKDRRVSSTYRLKRGPALPFSSSSASLARCSSAAARRGPRCTCFVPVTVPAAFAGTRTPSTASSACRPSIVGARVSGVAGTGAACAPRSALRPQGAPPAVAFPVEAGAAGRWRACGSRPGDRLRPRPRDRRRPGRAGRRAGAGALPLRPVRAAPHQQRRSRRPSCCRSPAPGRTRAAPPERWPAGGAGS